MKYLKFLVGFLLLFGAAGSLVAQTVVTGKYNGYVVKMKYYKGNPDLIQQLEYGLVNELNNTISKLKSEKSSLQKELNKLKGVPAQSNSGSDDSLQLRMLILERDLLSREKRIDSLNKRVEALNDSLLSFRRKLAVKETNLPVPARSFSAGCPHFGIGYRIGIPLFFSPIFSQKDASGQAIWNRRITLSHQVGLYWGSRSLVKNGSLSLGLGLEYSRLRFSAGIGHLSETLDGAVDADQCNYTAFLTYDNVVESATLHYINIPLTLSIGQPYNDRISGYFQLTLAPSFCVSSTLSATGYYSLAGHYSQISNTEVSLYLDDFQPLGFGSDLDLTKRESEKEASVNRFVLLGRISGGVYFPLCNLRKEKTSQWAFKLGVNLDMALTPVSKQLDADPSFPDATYRLDQCNLLSVKACRFVNPSLEIGIMYIIKSKQK